MFLFSLKKPKKNKIAKKKKKKKQETVASDFFFSLAFTAKYSYAVTTLGARPFASHSRACRATQAKLTRIKKCVGGGVGGVAHRSKLIVL